MVKRLLKVNHTYILVALILGVAFVLVALSNIWYKNKVNLEKQRQETLVQEQREECNVEAITDAQRAFREGVKIFRLEYEALTKPTQQSRKLLEKTEQDVELGAYDRDVWKEVFENCLAKHGLK